MSLGDEAYNKIVAAGDRWAEANFQAQQLEDTEKTFLYQLALDLMDVEQVSMATAEKIARGSTEFEAFVKRKCEVRREANKARVRYDAVRVLADMRRTEAANERKALGG